MYRVPEQLLTRGTHGEEIISQQPTLEERASGPAPGDLKSASGPNNMLVQSTPARAKSLVSYVAQNRKAKGVSPNAGRGSRSKKGNLIERAVRFVGVVN